MVSKAEPTRDDFNASQHDSGFVVHLAACKFETNVPGTQRGEVNFGPLPLYGHESLWPLAFALPAVRMLRFKFTKRN